MFKRKNHALCLLLFLVAFIQRSYSDGNIHYLPDSSLRVSGIPVELGAVYQKNFNRYTEVVAPNGKPIRIFVQDELRNTQVVKVRNVLEHYLTDYTGSLFGSNKGLLANQMANNQATLLLLNGKDGDVEPPVDGQPLYASEIQVEGDPWYVAQDYMHRDASYEEILHLVHDYGIGVDGPFSFSGVLPAFQQAIRRAQAYALTHKLWAFTPSAQAWVEELAEENSLSQEYLAAVIDSYYGLWGAWQEGKGSMWGEYVAKDRNELALKDPRGFSLASGQFFQPWLTYNALIDQRFDGTFEMGFVPTVEYTHHSRYLKNITLTGTNNIKVRVNELDNQILGNKGSNTVLFSGVKSEYRILQQNNKTIVEDKVSGRDGKNILINIQQLQFKDQEMSL